MMPPLLDYEYTLHVLVCDSSGMRGTGLKAEVRPTWIDARTSIF